MPFTGDGFNDMVSSLQIRDGYKVILYEHRNYGGRSVTVSGNVDWIGEDFNDIVSSLKIAPINSPDTDDMGPSEIIPVREKVESGIPPVEEGTDSQTSPPSEPSKPDIVSQVEAAILRYTNEESAKVGKSPYMLDVRLSDVVRSFSLDRLTNSYEPPDHVDREGQDPTARAITAGYQIQARIWTGGCTATWVGENMGYLSFSGYDMSPDEIGKKIVSMWMKSTGHKAAIIDDPTKTAVAVCTCNRKPSSCGFQIVGIGVARGEDADGTITYKATLDLV